MSIQVGDLNGDHKLDVVAADFQSADASLLVFLNAGDGTFAPAVKYLTGQGTGSVSLGDFDGDGKPDVVAANNGSPYVSVLMNQGGGALGAATNFPLETSLSVVAGDFTGDAAVDFVAVGASTALYVNRGGGTFAAPVALTAGGLSMVAADLNGDGKLDLVGGGSQARVSLNDGNGTFGALAQYPTAPQHHQGTTVHGVAVGDLNGDGRPDIAAANDADATVGVMFNQGAGTFGPPQTYASGSWPTSVAIGDLNGDGWPELVVTNSGVNTATTTSYQSTLAVFVNAGDGTFVHPPLYILGAFPYAAAIADLNGDGRADIVAGDGGGNLEVLLNTSH